MCVMRARRGFTLIELMIVAAVSVILLAAVFSVNFRMTDLWRSERVRQALQQNFRFAGDALTANLRQATDVLLPAQNTLGDVLEFDYIVTPSPAETRHRVTYARVGTGPYHVEKTEVELESYLDTDSVTKWRPKTGGTVTTVAVTEDITSLAALHFLHRGSRIVTILVAEYESGGSTRTISYTLQTSVRTLPLLVSPSP